MTALTFSQANGSYVATITGVTETINVDIERDQAGALFIAQKATGSTRYKNNQTLKGSDKFADLNFNIIQEADGASIDYQITSATPVTNAYYG